ncbi:DUF262 domain-containing protein [Paludibacter sp. 221]|uniref:DUF262 domain-containing protein n=1 Tax=Paludibacter sp. 221 TaxID=2302939 RepID=UPI0013D2FB0F|nr:DUF262 domain-containing protein [Paludibacter sp. 221]NDV46877.1 DUF262 domain-containing protein [Paludibacter sp. 221]
MPTNNVLNRNFEELFSAIVRYEIPFFQRGYAWEQRQWKKLFDDIDNEIFESVEDNNFENAEHFFGPIVVLEKISQHPSLKRFLIIDGQQRITTIYLLLSIIRKLLLAKTHLSTSAQAYIEKLDSWLINNLNDEDEYLKLKVFSTKGDRLPTFKALFDRNPNSIHLSEDQLLYDQNTNKVDEFIKFANKKIKTYDVPQLWQLTQAIIKSLKIVWIPLDEKKDDAQAIFESLNDAGMPLSASELLCNYIFKPLTNDATNEHERLHNEKWLKARREVGENNFEEYLRNLFSIGEKKRIGKERRMYVHFKIKNLRINADTAKATLDKILSYTTVYNNISKPIMCPHGNEKIKRLLIKIFDTNMSSINPFLMSLLKAFHNGALTEAETINVLHETFVLLVRRKVTKLPVTKYDTFFPSLLDKIINEPDKKKAFHTQVQTEQLWVSDQEFELAFQTKEIYNSRELNFSRLILQEIDRSMQQFGELPDYSTINTIEHILPQTLNDHWTVYLGEDALNINLPVIINTLGNLSLNSPPANSSFGQKPFAQKQKEYTDSSALARDVKARQEPWNIVAIEKRSKDLARKAIKIWSWSM